MAERVAEVEQGALATFERIARDHAGLELAAARDRLGQRGVVAREQGLGVRAQPVEETGVEDRPDLDHFGQARAQFAVGQGAQRGGVGNDHSRRVERADQVLAGRQVDRGLAADRRVDHRQQRGRHLDHVDPAHPARRGEAGEVADHAAAKRDHRRVAGRAEAGERVEHLAEARQGLFPFAGGHHETRDCQCRPRRAQCGLDAVGIQRRDMGVADDQDVAAAQRQHQPRAVVEKARTNRNRIRRIAGDFDRAHAAHAGGASGRRIVIAGRCHCWSSSIASRVAASAAVSRSVSKRRSATSA